jgi:hypothetical protein
LSLRPIRAEAPVKLLFDNEQIDLIETRIHEIWTKKSRLTPFELAAERGFWLRSRRVA